ncbi:MAG: putative transporter substrate-binding protein [Nocardioidaceae bacterium]|nr:putative transporter substrate-binding protein [Nocardioidaceae bacterium]
MHANNQGEIVSRTLRTTGAVLALALAATTAACSSPVDKATSSDRPTGTMTVGTGVKVDLDSCPSTWGNDVGVTKDTIKIGMSVPKSGPLASVGGLADGVKAYFDKVNAEDPIDGKKVVLDIRDDGYDPARTKTNVQSMLAANDIFAFLYIVGTANNAAVTPLLKDACTPQVEGGTGKLDLTAHPDQNPWMQDGLLSYSSEATLWCNDIKQRFGTGKTVAYLAMDNDFGDDYVKGIEACAKSGVIKVVAAQRHAPTAPSITNQLTTMVASKADIAMFGTTGSFCPQALTGLNASTWKPTVYLSTTCSRVGGTFAPIAPVGAGTLVAINRKDAADPQYKDDKDVQDMASLLTKAGAATDGQPSDGVLMAKYLEYALRAAAKMDGGLTRTNLLKVMWKSDYTDPLAADGITYKTDGVKDPLLYDAARIGEYQPPVAGSKTGSFKLEGDVLTTSEK